ncbi:hypothetical protein ILYODFUR_024644 [Ilyodon furcidens]|uniref:Uncharacterized protein n=1 Tax=Ilyodon furcidens TaxID=33524 RepID=A0ABV0VJI4_9TELE
MQFLKRRKFAANHPLCRANVTLQPALVHDGGSSIPDGEGGGEDELNNGRVEVYHHCLWQAECLQLLQEVHSLLSLHGEGGDVQLPLEILMVPRKQNESTMVTGESHRMMGVDGAVNREKSRGERIQPSGEPVLMVLESEACFPSFTCCFLSVVGTYSHGFRH